jgi:hypothetical protein
MGMDGLPGPPDDGRQPWLNFFNDADADSVMKFQARNLPDRIFCGTYAEVSNLQHVVL